MVPSTPERTNPGVADPIAQLVVALSIFGGVAVVTLGSNVLLRPSAAGPFGDFLELGWRCFGSHFYAQGPHTVWTQNAVTLYARLLFLSLATICDN